MAAQSSVACMSHGLLLSHVTLKTAVGGRDGPHWVSGELGIHRVPASVAPRQPLQPELWNNLPSNTLNRFAPHSFRWTQSPWVETLFGTMLAKLSARVQDEGCFQAWLSTLRSPFVAFSGEYGSQREQLFAASRAWPGGWRPGREG